MSAIAYFRLQKSIVASHGSDSALAKAIGKDWKGKLSLFSYMASIPLAFILPWISYALYVVIALVWIIPDHRMLKAEH